MRLTFMVLVLTATAWSQALTEAAIAAGGGSVGGVAGKQVADGVGGILQKVAGTAAKAADPKRAASPAVESHVARSVDRSLVPPPPPPHRVAAKVETTALLPLPTEEIIAAPPPPPPPPEVTAADLRTLSKGTGRIDVLKLGEPASRISMVEDGHLLEIYNYANHEMSFGVVRLNDGVVSSIEVR